MQTNLSDREKLLRTIFGVYLMLLGFLFIQGVVGILLGIVGLALLATGAMGWCPLYVWLKRSTAPAIPESAVGSQSDGEDK